MRNNITGRVICAGKLKDSNGDEFYGLMIECDLRDRAVPFYQDVEIVTASADPAPGHPELPLTAVHAATLKGLVNLPAKKFHFLDETDARLPTIAAADPLKVAMDDPVEDEDPTRRELPWGDLPEPPPLPEGKTRWVNRGEFLKYDISATGRKVAFLDAEGTWRETFNFSTILPHIEAI